MRERPAMYADDVHVQGYHRLLEEVTDNVLELAWEKACSRLDVVLPRDGP